MCRPPPGQEEFLGHFLFCYHDGSSDHPGISAEWGGQIRRKKDRERRGKWWLARKTEKQGDFFWRVTERGKGGRAAGEKSLLVGNFSRVSGKTTMSLVRFYFLEVPFFFRRPVSFVLWFSLCIKSYSVVWSNLVILHIMLCSSSLWHSRFFIIFPCK